MDHFEHIKTFMFSLYMVFFFLLYTITIDNILKTYYKKKNNANIEIWIMRKTMNY